MSVASHPLPAQRTPRIASYRDFAEVHRQRVECQQRVGQKRAEAEQVFDRFDGLDGADDSWQCADGALGNGVFRCAVFVEDAAVAGGLARNDGHGLAVEVADSGV